MLPNRVRSIHFEMSLQTFLSQKTRGAVYWRIHLIGDKREPTDLIYRPNDILGSIIWLGRFMI